MKKTDLYKNLGLAVSHRMKNASKVAKPVANEKAKTKQELASSNPLLSSLLGKAKSK